MTQIPAPLQKADVTYRERTPFADHEPAHVYENVLYEDGEIGGQSINDSRFEGCTFTRVRFNNVVRCMFVNCTFKLCDWASRATNVHFWKCKILSQDFCQTKFDSVEFRDSCLIESYFSTETSLSNVALWNVRGLESCWNLHEVEVIPGVHHAWQIELDAAIERTPLPMSTRCASWTALRTFGKLPFFGISYAGLIGTPAVIFMLSIYNDQIEHLVTFGEKEGGVGTWVGEHLHPIPVPSLSLLLLLSLSILAIASTVFAVRCPARIREFPYERWTDEFRRPGIQYLPLGWKRPLARMVCGICYPIGATGVAIVLVVKLIRVAIYIMQHSPMPWMLR